MTLTWVLCVRLNFYSLADAIWAYGFSVVAIVLGFCGSGWDYRKWIFALMLCCWSLRTGTYLLQKLRKNFPKEDPRYAELRTKWNDSLHWSFITLFLIQGLCLSLLSLPMMIVAANDYALLTIPEWLGFGLWCLAIVGEGVSIEQLEKFEANPENAGKTCDIGFWKWIPRPVLLFELLIWCSFALFASGSPYGWISWFCPLAILIWRWLFLTSGNHGYFPWSSKKKIS